MHSPAIVVRCFQENNGANGAGFQPAAALLPSRGTRPRSSPVRTWQSLRGRDVSGSGVRAMQPSSDAEKPSSPTVLVGKCLSPSKAPGLLSLGAPEPWSFAAGSCGQPCTGTGLCRVQHCRAFPALTAFLPLLLLVGIFSAVTTSPLASPWIPLCAPGAPFPGCCPQGGPWGSPSFPLALGSGEILHPGAVKGQSCLPGASSPTEPFGFPPRPWQMLLQQAPAWLSRASGSSPKPFPSIHTLEALTNRLCGE